MSIIYDALQKTQQNREYLKLHSDEAKPLPRRFPLKAGALIASVLVLSAASGFLISHSWKPVAIATQPTQAAANPAKEKTAANPESLEGTHLWVSDAGPSSTAKAVSEAAKVALEKTASGTTRSLEQQAKAEPVVAIAAPVAVVQPAPVVLQPAPVVQAAPQSLALATPVAQAAPVIFQSAPAPQLVGPPRERDDILPPPPAMEVSPLLTQALPSQISTSIRLTLNGVLISGADKVALINNQAFHLGDIIDGMKIVQIEINSVKLQSGQDLLELRVPV